MSAASIQPSTFAQLAPTAQFRNLTGDIYVNEIEQAVALGIVAGFKDQIIPSQNT